MMLRYRNTLPRRAARCPSQAATPPFCAVQRSGRKKIRKGTFSPKTMGKGMNRSSPRGRAAGGSAAPGVWGDTPPSLCLPIPPGATAAPVLRLNHRHGAVCRGSPESRAGQTQR